MSGFALSVPTVSLRLACELTSSRGSPVTHPPPAPSQGYLPVSINQSHCVSPMHLAQLFCLGVTEDSFYRTANAQRLEEKQRKRWVAQRAAVALYIASHRGHAEAVQYLLEHGNSRRQLSTCRSWGPLQAGRAEWLLVPVPPVLPAPSRGPPRATRCLSEVSQDDASSG